MANQVSFFNGSTYNRILWGVSGVCTLGKHHLGHNPRVAHLIKHDPYCPCGLHGAIQRNFRLFLTLTGAATLPLTYWKWKKLDYVVFGFCTLVFIGLMQWALKTANDHLINPNVQDCLSDETVGMRVYHEPVVHLGALKLKEQGDPNNQDDYELANCSTTYERSDLEKSFKEVGYCPGDRLSKEQVKIVPNYAAAALLNYAISLGEFVGKGNLSLHLLGTEKVEGYYPFDQLASEMVDPELDVIIAPDGHTYPKKGYQEEMGLSDEEMRFFPRNDWLASAIKQNGLSDE